MISYFKTFSERASSLPASERKDYAEKVIWFKYMECHFQHAYSRTYWFSLFCFFHCDFCRQSFLFRSVFPGVVLFFFCLFVVVLIAFFVSVHFCFQVKVPLWSNSPYSFFTVSLHSTRSFSDILPLRKWRHLLKYATLVDITITISTAICITNNKHFGTHVVQFSIYREFVDDDDHYHHHPSSTSGECVRPQRIWSQGHIYVFIHFHLFIHKKIVHKSPLISSLIC